MKRARSIMFIGAIASAAVLLCLLVSVLVVLLTEVGTQFAWRSAQLFLPDSVEVREVKGRLVGPLHIRGLKVKTDIVHLELESVELDWMPSGLFRRLISIDHITAEGLRYTQLEPAPTVSEEASKPFELPQKLALPLDVSIGKLSLRDVEIRSQPAADPLIIKSARLAAAADARGVTISEINVTAPLFAIEGHANLNTERNGLLDGELRWWVTPPEYATVNGRTRFKGTLRELTIHQHIAKPYDAQAVIELKDLLSDLKFDASVSLNQVELQPLNQNLPSLMVQLEATSKGVPNDYSIDIRANIEGPEQADAQLRIAGRGNQQALDLSRIDIKALEGEVTGRLQLSWQPELKGNVVLSAQGLNPGVVLKEWPGKLGVSLHAHGGIEGQKPSLQIEQLHAQGQLRGHNLSLDAAGGYAKNRTVLDAISLSSGSTRLHARGTLGDAIDVSWKLYSQDLGTLLPNAKGRVDGNGTIAGPVKRPRITATLTADGFAFSDYGLKSLNLDANVDLTGKNQSRIALSLHEGTAPGIELRKIALNGQGDPGAHVVTLAADTSQGQADIVLQGEMQHPWQHDMAWRFRLDQANLRYPNLAGWALQAPAMGHITATQMTFSHSCWTSGEALLCLQASQSKEGIQADFELKRLPFSYFAPYLPADTDIQGSLSGMGAFSRSGSQAPVAKIDLTTTRIRMLSRDANPQEQKGAQIIAFKPGMAHLQMQQGGLAAEIKLPLSQTDGIDLRATISPADGPLIEQPLNGRIITEIQDLEFIADLIPEVQDLSGRLTGDMALSGSLGSPVLSGRLALLDAAAKLNRPGLDLKDMRIELTGKGGAGMRLAAHAVSGNGELNIEGSADLGGKTSKADLKVNGKNFRVIDTLEAKVDVSPNLTLSLRGKRVDTVGDVIIPTAQIKLKTLPESAVKVSDDQVIVLSDEPERESTTAGREMYARVHIILGDEVSFSGLGLSARLEGRLLAIESPGEPTRGRGELKIVDGEYRAYGQGLVIEKGRILFVGGPINQPGIDVRALRRPAEGIVVGVQVRGNLKQPNFTLFSDPAMTQGNQLSYLVLGRPLNGTTGSNGSALRMAAMALGLKGGNTMADKIGGQLGFDQFGVDFGEAGSGTSPEQASFVIGKYLTPKLYISYGLGLFDPVSTARLQYAISSRWQLVTESSGAGSGGDLFYTIETGK